MEQLLIELPDDQAISQIYHLVNSQEFLDNVAESSDGNKSARRRLRKQLSVIAKLAKAARQELLKKT